MTLTRRTTLASGAAALAALMRPRAAEAATLEELSARARSEGQLTYYATSNPALSQRLVRLFNETYPDIRVNVIRLATGPLGKRYAAEAEAGNVVADILQLGDPLLMADGQQKGWFADISDLPAHRAWPQGFKDRFSAVVSLFPHTITYNKRMVQPQDLAQGWRSVLDPKWSRKIIMADPRNSPSLMEWAILMHGAYGPDFLRRLARQRPRYVASTIPGTQLVAAGEGAILVPNLRMVSFSLVEQNAPIDDVTPLPSGGLEAHMAVSTRARNPNAARLFANFILTPEGQTVLSKDVAVSPMPDVAGALPMPSEFHRSDLPRNMPRAPEMLELLELE